MPSMHTAGIFADMALDGPEIGTLVIIVDKAKNLPNRRTIGKQDPYCNARLGKEARKTKVDKRGGQTPRWDEELRFTVHDSPDYYQLKVSVFDEGKKTELIGESFVSLEDVIQLGGGEKELWVELKCKGRYAGEVRFELTFYDSRQPPEKPAKKAATDEMTASMRGRVARRPLPSNPTGAPAGDQLRTTGPRTFGTPPQHRQSENRKPVNNGDGLQPDRRLTSQSASSYAAPEEYDPFTYQQPQTGSYQHLNDMNHHGQQHNDPYAQNDRFDAASMMSSNSRMPSESHDFLPQLPPLNRLQEPTARQSRVSLRNEYEAMAHPPLDHTTSASVLEYHSPQPQRHQINHARSEPHLYHAQHDVDFDEGHSQHELQQEHIRQPSYGQADFHAQHDEFERADQYDEPQEAPPPPPAHRNLPALPPPEPYGQPDLSPSNSFDERAWSSQHEQRGGSYPDPLTEPPRIGHFQSRSEVSLARYREPAEIPYHTMEEPARRSVNAYVEQPSQDFGNPQRRYTGDMSPSLPSFDQRSSFSQSPLPSPMRKDVPHTPTTLRGHALDHNAAFSPDNRRESYQSVSSAGSFGRNGRYQSQPTPAHHASNSFSAQSPLYASSPVPSLHSVNGGNHTPSASPTRPHPLSQEQNAGAPSSYDAMPVIRPLAITPRKSAPGTPSSNDRLARPGAAAVTNGNGSSRNSLPRKSVSPRPSFGAGDRPNSSFFSPDSFDSLNPSLHNPSSTAPKSHSHAALAPDSSAPIVDFHGNVIDPSDRLPETSWAPEPKKVASSNNTPTKTHDDHFPRDSWAPSPISTANKPPNRKIIVRARDKVGGARAAPGQSPYEHHTSSPIGGSGASQPHPSRSSVYVPPGEGPGSAGRNRLRKQQRPVSVATTPHGNGSWSAGASPNASSHSSFNGGSGPQQQGYGNVPQPPAFTNHRGHSNSYGGGGGGGWNAHGAAQGQGPPIPAKIPMDQYASHSPHSPHNGYSQHNGHNGYQGQGSGNSMVPYGSSSSDGAGGMDPLSMELQSIDIGGVGDAGTRRIGGRRLLGYNPS